MWRQGFRPSVRRRVSALRDQFTITCRTGSAWSSRLDLVFEELGALDLKNIARPVEAFVVKLTDDAARQESTGRSLLRGMSEILPLPDKPSIVILPFQNLSSDPEQDYFADGMVGDITTAVFARQRSASELHAS